MHVGWRHMRVGDDGMAAIHGAVIQIEKTLRLTVAHHVAGVLVGAAHLDFLRLRLSLRLLFQGGLAMRCPILGDRSIQRRQVLLRLDCDFGQVELVLVGVGLQMRRIGIENLARGQPPVHRQQYDFVEYLLIDRALGETTTTILAKRRGVRNLVAKLQTKEPAVGNVHLHLPHQLPLRANSVQITKQQQLEQHHRLQRRTAVVLAVKVLHAGVDKTEIHHLVDLPQQVLRWHQRLH